MYKKMTINGIVVLKQLNLYDHKKVDPNEKGQSIMIMIQKTEV